ncbi:MAG: glycosyltransferase [Deltaproteobacteria bacterium]|nr:glycosyltransferase [Deltaproteobacteria bacterium]
MNPQVTVLMSVHNGGKHLEKAVRSVLEQTLGDFEFLIIDDGSHDQSAAILDDYRKRDNRVVVYTQTHKGLIFSLNKGCRLARGRYIALMDADDIAVKEKLERQIVFLEDNPDFAIVGGNVATIDDNDRVVGSSNFPVRDKDIKEALIHYCPLCHPTVVMRKAVFECSGGYRCAFVHAEDYDLWLRVSEHFKLANLSEVVLYKRVHTQAMSFQNLEQQAISSLGARISARKRSKTGIDPMKGVGRVTPDILKKAGLEDTDIQNGVLLFYLRWVDLLLMAHDDDGALQLINSLPIYSRPIPRDSLIKICSSRARIHRMRRELWRYAGLRMTIAILQPFKTVKSITEKYLLILRIGKKMPLEPIGICPVFVLSLSLFRLTV